MVSGEIEKNFGVRSNVFDLSLQTLCKESRFGPRYCIAGVTFGVHEVQYKLRK
jgi:hypothetical protein